MGNFRTMLESVQGEFQKKIRQAKKGECAGIMKELEAAFKDHKINQNEFDMLTAMTGRKMDKMDEAKEIKSAVLVKNYFNFKKGTKVKVLSFEGSGRYNVEFPDKSTDIIGVSSIAFSVTEAKKVQPKDFKKGDIVYYNNDKNVNDDLNGEKFTIVGTVGELFKIASNKLKQTLTVKDIFISLTEELDEAKKVQPKDFKKGDKVKWSSSFASIEKDMEGEVIGFKDHEDYKNGYLIIKGSDKKEYKLIFSGVTKLNEETESEELDEAIEGINNTGIGYVISYSMFMIAQTHIWHLLCKSGQKHVALKNFYDELQDEVDELAERFIAQGGILSDVEATLVARYDDFEIVSAFNSYREMVTSCVESRPEMASIVDGIVDLQEVIDTNLYKFNLN